MDEKPFHRYNLVYVIWEDGEGRMNHSVGWELEADKDIVSVAPMFTVHNEHEWISEGCVEIPTSFIVDKRIVQTKW